MIAYRYHSAVVLLVIGLFLAQGAEEPPAEKPDADALPKGAVYRLGSLRWKHSSTVSQISYSRNGKYLASRSDDGVGWLWEAKSGQLVRRFGSDSQDVGTIRFSPGSDLFAVSATNRIDVWQIPDKKVASFVTCQPKPDSPLAAYFSSHLAFSKDGRRMAGVGFDEPNHTVLVWDLETKKVICRRPSKIPIVSLSLSPDGKRLCFGDEDGFARLIDCDKDEDIRAFESRKTASLVGYSGDGKWLTEAWVGGSSVILRNPTTGAEVRTITRESRIRSIELMGDSRIAVADGRGLDILDLASKKTVADIRNDLTRNSSATALSPDDATLAVGQANGIRFMNLKGECDKQFSTEPIASCALSSDGSQAFLARPLSVEVWKVATEKLRYTVPTTNSLQQVALVPDDPPVTVRVCGGVLTLFKGKEVTLKLQPPRGHYGGPLAVSSDGKYVAVVERAEGEKVVVVLDTTTKKEVGRQAVSHETSQLAFSPKRSAHTLAAGTAEGHIVVWKLPQFKEVVNVQPFNSSISALVYSPDGKHVICGAADKKICFYELMTRDLCYALENPAEVTALASSPDGKHLVVGGGETASVWRVFPPKVTKTLSGHRGNVSSMSFSADGRRLMSTSHDTTALIWDFPELAKGDSPKVADDAIASSLEDLASPNGIKGHLAERVLAAGGKRTVILLKDQVKPASPVDVNVVDGLIAKLDSDSFPARTASFEKLKEMDVVPKVAAERALKAKELGAEKKRLLRKLLDEMDEPPPAPILRSVRAVAVLENIGTPEARETLTQLSKGDPNARVTQEAQASLVRLSQARR